MLARILGALVLVASLSPPARAVLHPDANDLAISFAVDGFVARQFVEAGAEFDVYVLLHDPVEEVARVEFTIDGLGTDLVVIEEEYLSGAQDSAIVSEEYLLSFPRCRGGSLVPLLRVRLRASSQITDGQICLTAPQTGSLGAFPALGDCTGSVRTAVELWPRIDPREDVEYPDGCLVVNPSSTTGSAQTIYSLPELFATPGETLSLPLTADVQPVTGGASGSSVFAVEGLLTFDSSILAFRGVERGIAVPHWTVESAPLQPGVWEVRAEDPDLPAQPSNPPLGDPDGQPVLHLEFEVLAPGTANVFLQLREIVDISPSTDTPCCVVRQVGHIRGAITQNPVPIERATFGALKSRY